MNSPVNLPTLTHGQVTNQSDSSSPTPATGLAKEIENKVTTALRFSGLDVRFASRFVRNLKDTVKPACIVAGSCFVVLHLFPTIGISAIVGVAALVNLAISRARLEMMKEDLEAAKQAGTEAGSANQKLGKLNAELIELNQQQKETLDKQKETINEAQQNLTTVQNKLLTVQETLAEEQQLKELHEKQIATQEARSKIQEDYIGKCHTYLVSVFTSQNDLVGNLERSLKRQTEDVLNILKNVKYIADGEKILTEALTWSQERISAAQSKLRTVINLSMEVTDPEKLQMLITDGEFAKKAREMQQAAQEAYDLMGELNAGLTDRIIKAQTAISSSRQAAETELQKLTSEQQKANQALEQAQRQIQQREQEIEHLNREHQTILQNNTKEIQTLTVEIETKRQSLGELTKEKGTLEENLRNVEARCSEFREKVQSFTSSNETLQAQFLSQGRLVEQQKETIDTQRRALTAAQEAIDSLRNQTQGGRGFLQTFVQTAGVVAGGMLGIAVTRAL